MGEREVCRNMGSHCPEIKVERDSQGNSCWPAHWLIAIARCLSLANTCPTWSSGGWEEREHVLCLCLQIDCVGMPVRNDDVAVLGVRLGGRSVVVALRARDWQRRHRRLEGSEARAVIVLRAQCHSFF